ncbi:MAG TPA: choice-of-anchor R domain-containing protein, partial [Candidatus Hydrogenedentes bacterium]|nr:choice-of-anchor R domain-containing protein [Candidatus Hydrogenedentota bacterium]
MPANNAPAAPHELGLVLVGLGVVVAQSFTLPVDVPFTVAEIYVRVKRVGNPADSIKVGLRADSAGEPSGTDIETATILGSALGETMTWVKFTMANTTALAFGTTYWLLVSKTSGYS